MVFLIIIIIMIIKELPYETLFVKIKRKLWNFLSHLPLKIIYLKRQWASSDPLYKNDTLEKGSQRYP